MTQQNFFFDRSQLPISSRYSRNSVGSRVRRTVAMVYYVLIIVIFFTLGKWFLIKVADSHRIIDQRSVKAFAQSSIAISSPSVTNCLDGDSNPVESCTAPETARSTYPLQEVKNFRDVAATGTLNRFQRGKIYRTGSVSRANQNDAVYLREVVGIKTFLDLRSEQEVRAF